MTATSNDALRLQKSLLEEVRRIAAEGLDHPSGQQCPFGFKGFSLGLC